MRCGLALSAATTLRLSVDLMRGLLLSTAALTRAGSGSRGHVAPRHATPAADVRLRRHRCVGVAGGSPVGARRRARRGCSRLAGGVAWVAGFDRPGGCHPRVAVDSQRWRDWPRSHDRRRRDWRLRPRDRAQRRDSRRPPHDPVPHRDCRPPPRDRRRHAAARRVVRFPRVAALRDWCAPVRPCRGAPSTGVPPRDVRRRRACDRATPSRAGDWRSCRD